MLDYFNSYTTILLSVFFFKQKTAYEVRRSLVGSEMYIRDRNRNGLRLRRRTDTQTLWHTDTQTRWHTQTHTHTQTYTDTQTHRHKDTHTHTDTQKTGSYTNLALPTNREVECSFVVLDFKQNNYLHTNFPICAYYTSADSTTTHHSKPHI